MARPNWDNDGLKLALSRGGAREKGGADVKRSRGGHLGEGGTVCPAGIKSPAGSNPAPSPYKSKLERAYAEQLALARVAGLIQSWDYEPISFKLAAGKRYRPDFLVWRPDGGIECHEVKGRWIKNKRDSMTHLKWAAQRYPMFTWVLVERSGHGFVSTIVTV